VSHASAIRAAGLFAVLGALSGLVCAFTPIVEALNISLGWTGLFSSSATVPPLPGMVFGLLLSFLIYRHTSNVFRAASGIVTSLVAWIIAVPVAEQFGEVWSGGLAGGAVGAALTIAGVALAVPGYRSLWSMVLTVLVGAVCGLLLVFMDSDASPLSMLPLYAVWQASVAAMIAYGIAKGAAGEPHTILTPASG